MLHSANMARRANHQVYIYFPKKACGTFHEKFHCLTLIRVSIGLVVCGVVDALDYIHISSVLSMFEFSVKLLKMPIKMLLMRKA